VNDRTAISGRRRFALKSHGNKYLVLDGRDDMNWAEISPFEASVLMDRCEDLQCIQYQDDQQIISALAIAVAQTTALDLLLFVFDANLTVDTRCAAADDLERLLPHLGVEQFLEDLFLSEPLPDGVESRIPHQIIGPTKTNVKRLVEKIIQVQPGIRRVRSADDRPQLFGRSRDGSGKHMLQEQ
jgi:hypothetical protein